MSKRINNHNPVRKAWRPGTVFGGEVMKCFMCGKEEKSDPGMQSGWTFIKIGNHKGYFCPDHLPSPGSDLSAYRDAYILILTRFETL